MVIDCGSLQDSWFTKAAVSATLQNLTPGAAYTLDIKENSGAMSGGNGSVYLYAKTFAFTADVNGIATVGESATARFVASGSYSESLSLGGQQVDRAVFVGSACTPDKPKLALSLNLDCPDRYVAAGTVYGKSTRLQGTMSGLTQGVKYSLTTLDTMYAVSVTADGSGTARVDASRAFVALQAGFVDHWTLTTPSQAVVLASGTLDLAISCPALIPAPRAKVTHDYDISGDGYADLLSIDNIGRLRYYPNNSHSNPGHVPFVSNIIVGSGWNGLRFVSAGDVNGDGLADLVGSDQSGSLRVYMNLIKTSPKTPFGRVAMIGSGWNSIVYFYLGDVTGDGYADIIAYRQDGSRWLYENRYKTDPLHRPFSSSVRIGTASIFSFKASAGDVNGDGYADIVDAPNLRATIFPNLTPAGGQHDPFATGVDANVPSADWPEAGYALGDWEGRGYDSLIAANPGNTGNLVYVKDPFPTTGEQPVATVISTGWQVIAEIVP
jgi:VCBS repeat protein